MTTVPDTCIPSFTSFPRVGHLAYAFGFLSMSIHAAALIVIIYIIVKKHIKKKDATEKFSNLDDVSNRVCIVATNNPKAPFHFTAPDIPALRSIPGSPNECYFMKKPADAEDVDCKHPAKWNIHQNASDIIKLSSKIVNGSSRCVVDIKQGEAHERYAAIQKQMVQRNKGVDDLELNIANEKKMTLQLERELAAAKEKLQQLQDAPKPIKDVCKSKSRLDDMKQNAAYLQGAKRHLSNKLELGNTAFDNESHETLAALLEMVCNASTSNSISRCDALKVSSILQKPAKEWTSSDRQDVLISLRIVGGAAPGSSSSNEDLRILLKNICTSTSPNRCERLHPVYAKIMKDKSYKDWTQDDRSGVLMLIWAQTGLGLQHLGNDVLALFAERLCSVNEYSKTSCHRMGGEMMPPPTKPPNTWGPAEINATKTLIAAITGSVPDNDTPTDELKKQLDKICST